MPFIQVHLLAGRSKEQFEDLAKGITEVVVKVLGVAPESVWIEFIEMPKDRFSISGVLYENLKK